MDIQNGHASVASWAPLVDVNEMPMLELLQRSRHPALTLAIERIVASLDNPDGIISAFQSFASSPQPAH